MRVGKTVQLHFFLGSCRKASLTSCHPLLSVPEVSAPFLLTFSPPHSLSRVPSLIVLCCSLFVHAKCTNIFFYHSIPSTCVLTSFYAGLTLSCSSSFFAPCVLSLAVEQMRALCAGKSKETKRRTSHALLSYLCLLSCEKNQQSIEWCDKSSVCICG